MQFLPKEYQAMAINFIVNNKRCNLFVSPGMGKTSIVLSALNELSIFEDVYPALIVAPIKVARSVWDSEALKWDHLKRLTFSKILGDVKSRRAGLKAKADIYIINYENLEWLSKELGGKWKFRTVVCDESSRIKGHRVSSKIVDGQYVPSRAAGGKYARSLVKHAAITHRWINLTGTPTSNGLGDLWGQQYPIDFGKALGKSFSEFEYHYFSFVGNSYMAKRVPRGNAKEDITKAIAGNTLTLDAYDWFDISKPMVQKIYIELTPQLQKIYNKLHNESVIDIDEKTSILAESSSMKCRQFASGAMLDEYKQVHAIHDLKLEALEDLIESLSGAPLIVAYNFIHDKNRILERFKKIATIFPANNEKQQKEVEAAWNRGDIPLLLLHPQSAGHGLNLQYGGNNICIFTPDWNAEYYEQVIERIGPTRQSQAGLKRLTYVHILITKHTWDEAVVLALENKGKLSKEVRLRLAIGKAKIITNGEN